LGTILGQGKLKLGFLWKNWVYSREGNPFREKKESHESFLLASEKQISHNSCCDWLKYLSES